MQPVTAKPLYIRMHADDNVAIVANRGGLHPGAEFACGLRLVEQIPQGHKVALADIARRRNHSPLWRGHWPCRSADRQGELGPGSAGADAGRAVVRRSADAERRRDQAAAARRLHVRGLPQRRRFGRHQEHPRHHDHRAMRRRHRGVSRCDRIARRCCRAFPTSTTWSRSPTPTAAASRSTRPAPRCRSARCSTSPASQPRRRGRWWSAWAARSCSPSGCCREGMNADDERHPPAGRARVRRDRRGHHALAEARLQKLNRRRRETCPASGLVVGLQCGGSDAFSGVTCNPAVGYRGRPAGARRRHRDVLRSHRSARRRPPADAARRQRGRGRALIREMRWYDEYLARGERRPQRQPHARQQARRPVEHRGEGAGFGRQGRHRALIAAWLAPASASPQKGPGVRRHAGQRFHLRHAATGLHEPARLHHRARERPTGWRWCR